MLCWLPPFLTLANWYSKQLRRHETVDLYSRRWLILCCLYFAPLRLLTVHIPGLPYLLRSASSETLLPFPFAFFFLLSKLLSDGHCLRWLSLRPKHSFLSFSCVPSHVLSFSRVNFCNRIFSSSILSVSISLLSCPVVHYEKCLFANYSDRAVSLLESLRNAVQWSQWLCDTVLRTQRSACSRKWSRW